MHNLGSVLFKLAFPCHTKCIFDKRELTGLSRCSPPAPSSLSAAFPSDAAFSDLLYSGISRSRRFSGKLALVDRGLFYEQRVLQTIYHRNPWNLHGREQSTCANFCSASADVDRIHQVYRWRDFFFTRMLLSWMSFELAGGEERRTNSASFRKEDAIICWAFFRNGPLCSQIIGPGLPISILQAPSSRQLAATRNVFVPFCNPTLSAMAFLLGFLLGFLALAALEASALLLLIRRLRRKQEARVAPPGADELPGQRPFPYEKQVSDTPLLLGLAFLPLSPNCFQEGRSFSSLCSPLGCLIHWPQWQLRTVLEAKMMSPLASLGGAKLSSHAKMMSLATSFNATHSVL
jgi:hypothetical protein